MRNNHLSQEAQPSKWRKLCQR